MACRPFDLSTGHHAIAVELDAGNTHERLDREPTRLHRTTQIAKNLGGFGLISSLVLPSQTASIHTVTDVDVVPGMRCSDAQVERIPPRRWVTHCATVPTYIRIGG